MGKQTKADITREALREQLWPGSGARVWKGPEEVGYWCAPRVLPLILFLAADKKLVGKPDCSAVYLELLARDLGQGIVEILDEDEHAFFAGYTGERARRTWQERVQALTNAGFIEIRAKGNRKFGYILLLHPAAVVAKLRQQGKIADAWWTLYQQRLRQVGAPTHAEIAPEFRVLEGQAGRDSAPTRRQRK
ncbi:MAG TPA: hypothetical protein VGS57_11015 [Thermoanaerobaculia bacterium]|jgi:hypothetical protein|nr:hypothetical protein [Thermoanaerobaculia bacterium]